MGNIIKTYQELESLKHKSLLKVFLIVGVDGITITNVNI